MMIEKQNMEFGKPEQEEEAEADSRRSKRPRKGWMKTRFLGMIDDDDDKTENGVFGEACRVLTY